MKVITTDKRNKITGTKISEKYYHLNKFVQAIVFILQNREDRIEKNTNY